MRIFRVNISYSVTLDAEDEDDAKRQAVDCYEFGSADYEVIEIPTTSANPQQRIVYDDTLFLDGEYYPLKTVLHENDVVSQYVYEIKEDDNG